MVTKPRSRRSLRWIQADRDVLICESRRGFGWPGLMKQHAAVVSAPGRLQFLGHWFFSASAATAKAPGRAGEAEAIMADYRILTAGDTAIVVEFGDNIDSGLNAIVLALARGLDGSGIPGLNETIPNFPAPSRYSTNHWCCRARCSRVTSPESCMISRSRRVAAEGGVCRFAMPPRWRRISRMLRPAPA